MAYVITDACTKDFVCVESCPTNSIHPTQDENADAVAQLFINPDECIDCGACASNCPAGAIFSAEELPADKADFVAKNAAYFN